jgi:DNA gyrase subunit A
MGRTARGVRGVKMPGDGEVISLIIPRSTVIDAETEGEEGAEEAVSEQTTPAVEADRPIYILTASENGYGKRTRLQEFPLRGRGGQGVIAMQTSARNGALVSAIQVEDGEEMMLITNRGTLVRTRVDEVSTTSRNTQGVTLIRLSDEEKLCGTVRVQDIAEDLDESPEDDEAGNEE